MSRKGRKFENAYEWLYSLDDNYRVTSPAFLYDKVAGINREIDVLVEYTDNQGVARKISIECRDRKSTQDVMWIEQLQQKREDIGLDYIIAATTSHFSEAAIKKAKYHGVIIEQAEMLNKNTVESNVQKHFFDASIDIKMEECKDMEFPPELDKRCRALIQREYAKQKNKARKKMVLRVCRSAAVVAIALLSLCSVLFMTVEAFRISRG